MKNITWKIVTALSLATAFNSAFAQNEPVVGVWEKLSVGGPGGTLVARTNYVFTNRKLTEETIFSGIKRPDPLAVICCIRVKNLKPLELKDILARYNMDSDFVDHMKSVKGAEFIYEAEPIEKPDWNRLMTSIMRSDNNPNSLSGVSAPVISARLGKDDEQLEKLELGPTKTKLKVTYTKDERAIYQFNVKGKQITFSEDTFAH